MKNNHPFRERSRPFLFPKTNGARLALLPFISSMLLLLLSCSLALQAQQSGPGAVWSASVNFNTQGAEDAWAFDVEEAAGGEFVLAGYVSVNGTRVPGYAVVSKDGALITSNYFNTGFGQFGQIEKRTDGLIIAGHQNDAGTRKIFVIKLNNDFSLCWQTRYDAPGNEFVASVDVFTGSDGKTNIVVTAGDNIANCIIGDGTCNPTFIWSHVSLAGLTGRIWDMKLVPEGAPTHVIFTGEIPITVPGGG